MNNEKMTYKQLMKYANIMTENKIKCNCGHSVVLPPKVDKIICHWCNNYVFKNKKIEFEYRMQEMLKRKVEENLTK